MVNENDVDVKLDRDPTESLLLNLSCDLPYKQIFFETMKFINDNNTDKKPHLQYPRLYLNRKKHKCNDKQNCQQCYNKDYNQDSNNNNSKFILCCTNEEKLHKNCMIVDKKNNV